MVEMRYDPPGGVIGASIAKLFGESGQEVVNRDLQAFKNVLETGDVVHSDSSIYPRPHPARPPEDKELEKARLLNTQPVGPGRWPGQRGADGPHRRSGAEWSTEA